ncbi:MAG: hypothetical protein IKN11_08295, partial [Bacteroidales bacterium]|nr:hypothetical protein [Bacteroidales bacterium]
AARRRRAAANLFHNVHCVFSPWGYQTVQPFFATSPLVLPYFSHISPMQDGRNMGELTLKKG